MEQSVIRRLAWLWSGIQFTRIRELYTGKLNSDGTVNADPRTGLTDPAYIWCHDPKKRVNIRVANNKVNDTQAGIPVLVGESTKTGELTVIDMELTSSRPVLGNAINHYSVPETIGELQNSVVKTARLNAGRVRPSGDSDLKVWVESFWYIYNGTLYNFAGSLLNLTADVPGTANKKLLSFVYYDPLAQSLGSTVGSETALAMSFGASDQAAIDISKYIPLATVELSNGQTAITADNIDQSVRVLFNPAFYSTSRLPTQMSTIPAGETHTIPAGRNVVLAGPITVDGTLTIDGTMTTL